MTTFKKYMNEIQIQPGIEVERNETLPTEIFKLGEYRGSWSKTIKSINKIVK